MGQEKNTPQHIVIVGAGFAGVKAALELAKQKNISVTLVADKPDFIYYLCGVDVLETDKLGKLKLSLDACAKRDELVFEFAKAKKCPVVCAMGGGYSEKLSVIVDAHCKTFEKASEIFF